jgi:hypothetical protein
MIRGKDFYVTIHMRTDLTENKMRARDRLHRWLECYGYTSTGHGFEFIETINVIDSGRRVHGKRSKPAKSKVKLESVSFDEVRCMAIVPSPCRWPECECQKRKKPDVAPTTK